MLRKEEGNVTVWWSGWVCFKIEKMRSEDGDFTEEYKTKKDMKCAH